MATAHAKGDRQDRRVPGASEAGRESILLNGMYDASSTTGRFSHTGMQATALLGNGYRRRSTWTALRHVAEYGPEIYHPEQVASVGANAIRRPTPRRGGRAHHGAQRYPGRPMLTPIPGSTLPRPSLRHTRRSLLQAPGRLSGTRTCRR